MSQLTPKPQGHPIKIVRDKTPNVINSSGEPGTLFYGSTPLQDRLSFMKKKLGEEVAEFLVDGGFDELCDVYAVVIGLALHFGYDAHMLAVALQDDPRGGFFHSVMMYGHHEEFDGKDG